MSEKNTHYTKEAKHRRKRRGHKILILFLLVVVTVTALFFFFSRGDSKKNIIADPANAQLNTAASVHEPESDTEDNDLESEDTDWNLKLVNRWNPLPENYDIDLVEVPGGEKVDKRIYEPLMEMLEAAKEGNWNQLPVVVSGYRTQKKQQELYDEKIAEYRTQGYSKDEAVKQAEQWVAVPGCSEHQLGIAVDINGATYDLYFWLQENSYKYGFIFRYPGGKTNITGTAEEVWHYRYVGVEAATEMYKQGLCLEEYLGANLSA